MTSVHQVPAYDLIVTVSEKLKEKYPQVKPPEWSKYVKTGAGKEKPPVNPDWWYIRAASLLRKLAIHGPMGVGKARKMYGNRKRNGTKPEHFHQGSGKIIRTIFQQLEKANLVKLSARNVRELTPEGWSFLMKTVNGIKQRYPELRKYH